MISILIPTLNRPEFVIRYIDYLRFSNFKGELLIGDSSNNENYDLTHNYIVNNNFSFKILQKNYPGKMHFEVIRDLLPYISMPYSIYMCDDDFLVINTLEKCAEFLSKNLEYSAVGGKGIMCNTNYINGIFEIQQVYEISFYNLLDDSPLERLEKLTRKYNVIAYSLVRTEDFIQKWPISIEFNEKELSIELLPCFVSAIQGKILFLDDLFIIRTNHEKRILLQKRFNIFLDSNWRSSFIFTINYLLRILKNYKLTNLDSEIISENLFNSISFYYIRSINNKYKKALTKKTNKLHIFFTENYVYKYCVKIYNYLYYKLHSNFKIDDFSLKMMLKEKSKHHIHFMKFYKIINTKYDL
jgi:glycosyltransferase domain-containing protein